MTSNRQKAIQQKPGKETGQGSFAFRDIGGEKLLQFIWQFGYYNNGNLSTTEGEKLTIIFPGIHNTNAGPDFTGAKIRIGETTFFGNVELHLKTSDWEKHRHQSDNNYRNVVLHVVFKHDKELDHTVPVLELESRVPTLLLERYFGFMNARSFVPCGASIVTVKELVWVAWKERLLVERLTRKTAHIFSLLEKSNYHWEEVLWWQLARNFGSKANGDAFEAIAKSIPTNVLAKHRSSIHLLEALLFGQAGLLENSFEEDYPRLLQREYRFLQKKLNLKPVAFSLQFLRMRPAAFPSIRLALLAAFIQQSSHLFSAIIEADDVAGLKSVFEISANDYWHYHYTFGRPGPFKIKNLGSETVDNIIINTIVPMVFAYGLHHQNDLYKDKALRWLEVIQAEKNNITTGFAQLGIGAKTAYDSQALIELKNEYCIPRKCLSCPVGNFILKKEAMQEAAASKPAFK